MLQGKSVLVTGSTSGIGLGVATAFAQKGANIMLNGFGDEVAIQASQQTLRDTYGVQVAYNGADLRKPDEIKSLIAETAGAFGGVDILVNNAGIQHVAPVEEMPVGKWNDIIAINLSASFHTIRAVVPIMKQAGWGRIVNVASVHALVASPFKSAYVAAKHGVAGLTKSVALEVAEHNITCNAVCPGYVLTDLVKGQIPDTAAARGITEEDVIRDVLLAEHATKQFVTIEQVSQFVAYLCSDGASAVTGSILPIDGGWTAH